MVSDTIHFTSATSPSPTRASVSPADDDSNAQRAYLNHLNRVAMGLGVCSVADPDTPAYSAIPTEV
jgi:hypothetical protein